MLGVSAERTYVDHGLTGTNRERPGLREALAACRSGDTLVTKLDRLARSLLDAREILEDLTRHQVKLSIGGSVHDPTDPVGRLLFNVLRRFRVREQPRVYIFAAAACFSAVTRIELHFHLLPGVDDGPRTLDESLALARLAAADGTGLVICTPHVEVVDLFSLPDRVRELDAALRDEQIPLQIKPGGEIRAGTSLTCAQLEILGQGPSGRRWVLLEAPLETAQIDVFHAHADELEGRGYGLLIGHPERCEEFMAPDGGLERRLRRGAKLQVNASSLTGAHDRRSLEAGFSLLARGLVAVLASDAHGSHRPPLLRVATRTLGAHGIDSDPLTANGPRRLIREGLAAHRDRPAT
jgi:protein-tyrosine phosphatase